MHPDSDIQLMLSFKEGDSHAFHKLFDKYKKRMINYCYRYSGNHAVAEELAQETFIRVYKAASRYHPKARFSTWLYKIATNVCLNEMRKQDYRNKIESIDNLEIHKGSEIQDRESISVDEDLENSEKQKMVRKAIQLLPEKQRAALLLRIDCEFSYREIGKQIHCTENHVKILIHRARHSLRNALE